jgi:hypothetical protein
MPKKRLSDAFCQNVALPKADGKRQVHYFERIETGLSLDFVVSYGGSKRWRAIVYRNGKPHSEGLGNYPEMKLKDAREKARAYLNDPKRIEAAKQVGTFKEVAETYLKRYVREKEIAQRRRDRKGAQDLLPEMGRQTVLGN